MSGKSALRIVGTTLVAAGFVVLAWAGTRVIERQAAQRAARSVLEAEADALAASVVPTAEGELEPAREPPAHGSVIARIVAPSAGVDVVAHEGVDRKTLDLGAGHFPGTALPGEPGNSAFAGHRDVEFRGLGRIASGDDVFVDTGEATFVYRVAATRVVEPSEVDVLASRGASDLTLVTCYPFDWVGPAPRRFVVQAEIRGRFDPEDDILSDVLDGSERRR